ncbi:DUF3558 family protein [Nocardia gipuzkoensis]|uniref:DUF3558 family protein n=1 Tax=Nocardia gipuzkoensis TaxID=2749991 RepID=UPI0038CD2092
MRKPSRVAIICVLLCAALSGCTRDKSAPVDTTSTAYMFDNIFNPCRQMPQPFLDRHQFGSNPESTDNRIEDYVSLGCFYQSPKYHLAVGVSNAPLSEVGRTAPHTFQTIRIAGRSAKIQSLPQEQRFCVLRVEMTGGILSLYLSHDVALDPCTTLTALAEELVPLLPPGV